MERTNFGPSLTEDRIESWVSDDGLKVVQTFEPVDPRIYSLLNERLFSRRPDVELRVYGGYRGLCDLSFAKDMSNVERFAADCLLQAVGVDGIGEMPRLRNLSIGIYDLESFDFLARVPTRLESLLLGRTRSKKPSIGVIERFKSLRTLYIEGQQKGIEALSALSNLEDLTLRSITAESLEFLRPLERLWSLDIKLGGTRNLNALRSMANVKYLELWQIQGFEDLSPVAEMSGLQNLLLQSLPRIRRLPDLSHARDLRRIVLRSMKGLESLSETATAPHLEDFALIDGPSLAVESYQALLEHPKLRRMLVSGGGRTEQALAEKMRERGIERIERLYAENAFVYI